MLKYIEEAVIVRSQTVSRNIANAFKPIFSKINLKLIIISLMGL